MTLIHTLLIRLTRYAWLALLAGPLFAGLAIYEHWAAQGDHAYKQRDQLHSVTGKVTGVSEITKTRKKRTVSNYLEISVTPEASSPGQGAAEVVKLRLPPDAERDFAASLDGENIAALFDAAEQNAIYDLAVDGRPAIRYEDTAERLHRQAVRNDSGNDVAAVVSAVLVLMVIGIGGIALNRRLRRVRDEATA